MSTQLEPHPDVQLARERHAAVAGQHGELNPATLDAASELALAQLRDGDAAAAIALLRELSERATADLGEESEVTGIALAHLADALRHAGAPEAEQLPALSDAIKAFSASVGPSHPRTTSAFARLAHVALNAQAVEVAVTAGMQALAGLQTRGEGESAQAGEVYATLAMAAAARQSPAALGAAERAHTLTAGLANADPARKRARTAWSALGSPRRLPVTGELAVIAFGAPPSLVVELSHVADDGAADQHDHGLRADAARAFRDAIATAPFSWRASAGGFEVASRSGDGAVLRFLATHESGEDVELLLDATGLQALRAAVADALGGLVAPREPGRNDPCPCGSGAKYKRCCGR
ncbi:MAG TPA: SEC-C metal-binding domain-containing protein [Solirubrobacteraceae bacterium]